MSTDTRIHRVLTDASHTFQSGVNTGVQRVVRNIYRLSGKTLPRVEHKTIVVNNSAFRSVRVRDEDRGQLHIHRWQVDPVGQMPSGYRALAEFASRVAPFPFVKRWLLPKSGHLGAFKFPLKAYTKWLRRGSLRHFVDAGKGDLVLLPDAYWAKEEIWPAVAAARAQGAKVAVVVYDLIPLTHPQFVDSRASEPFKNYLKQVARHSDMVVAISETVRCQVEELFQTDEYRSDCRNFSSFELGAEFSKAEGAVRESVKQVFPSDATNSPYLMVATFDPRKNHNYALDAFERVWQQQPDRKLCFIGRVGWLCEDVVDRIRNHPRFGKQLFALHDVSDVELNYCYERARAVVFPSIVEGFGLPIVEALWHGRHVFASDTAIHREVGREECYYCDLENSESLATQILSWELEVGEVSPRRQSDYVPLSWESSIASLIDQCVNTLQQPSSVESTKQAA